MMFLAFIAAVTAPQPTELKLFRDWMVGCDNGRACHAVALMPEEWAEGSATMSVRRGPAPDAQPVMGFEADQRAAAALAVDGRKLAVRLVARGGDGPQVAPADMAAFLAALRSGQALQLLGADGALLGTISLAGASAALLYMDDQQKRVGTATALMRPGPRPASSVPPPPRLPRVRAAPKGRGFPITRARIAALRREAGCGTDQVGGPDTFEASAIDPEHMLVLLACGSGAYNVTHIPYIATRRGNVVRMEIARFDIQPGWWEAGRPTLINGVWDSESRQLVSFSKARGLGDCGTDSGFAWDGARFRLIHQAEMDECRGSTDYITTWRAEVVQP